nr:putative zinc finger, CCHC-type [Tanacetum cinerariifolium]
MGNASNNAPFASKPKTPPPPKKDNPVKVAICHQCGKVRHWRRNCPVYLAELIKKKKISQGASTLGIFTIGLYSFPSKSWIYDTGCGIHICITTQGLRGSKKLKLGALSLYLGDGHRATVEAIGTYHLEIPSGLVIILNNYHYAPSITRGKYVSCMSGKMARKPYSHQVERAKDLLGLIYTDVCGPFKIVSRQGANYFVTFTNDFSRYGYVYLLKHKHEVFETFKEHGIITHRTPPYTPQNNGLSERRNRTLIDMVRSMMSQTTLQKSFWDYALETTARILNMVPTKKRDTLTKPDKLDPRSFKCIFIGYPKETMRYSFYNPSENKVFIAQNAEFFKSKLLDLKASGSVEDLELIQKEDTNPSVDTSLNHKEDDQETNEPHGHINPIRKSSRTRRAPDHMCLYIDAGEHELEDLGKPANYKAALQDLESKKWLDAMNVKMQSMKDNDVWVLVELPLNARTVDDQETDEPHSHINPIRKSSRTRRAPDHMCLYIDDGEHELEDLGKPANYKAALQDPESKKWLDAMNVKMQSMKDNDVWVLVELPPNARTVGSKWLFKKKTDMDGAIYIFKARLVTKGFTQDYVVDFEETFSPVVDIRAIGIFIAIAAYYDYEIWQMDVKTAFLNGHLSEEVYMKQPEGFVNPKYPNHDRLKLKELMELSTKLSDRVLDLENIKTAQAKEIANLKKKVKKLERKRRSRTLWMNLFKIGTSKRRSLREKDASKQGMNLK